MEQIKTANGRKLMNYASILEDNTREQAERTASMPFIYPHMALMPDAHLGMGATVGSVIPTERALIPAAVGVDIGCGMMALRTQFTLDDLADRITERTGDIDLGDGLADLHADISARIPLSAGGRNTHLLDSTGPRLAELHNTPGNVQADEVLPSWELQLGTLGSGNHFIEVSLDETDRVWLFLHSGSRGVGNKLAQKWIKVARDHAEKWHIPLSDPDLAYLVEDTPEFDGYLEALRWAQRFAYLNREEMMHRTREVFEEFMGAEVAIDENPINCHHNYSQKEYHFGRSVWVSRKGAIQALSGQLGLIPGSMGDKSYVVAGKGNPVALESAPHGAGRAHSRRKAKELFTRETLDTRMTGVAWGHSDAFIDEHPEAYKPIDTVMADAADLVDVVHTLHAVCNVKGG